jgi:hypothetical protein
MERLEQGHQEAKVVAQVVVLVWLLLNTPTVTLLVLVLA